MELEARKADIEKGFETQRISQIQVRDDQAEGYVARYLSRGPTFIQLDEKLMMTLPQFESNQRVLDAGSGVGYFSMKIARLVKWVDAVDFSVPSLQVLEKTAAAAGIQNIRPLAGDLTKPLEYADQSFDRIVSHQVLPYLPPELLPSILDEFHRVLKPGGSACFSLFKFGWRGHFRSHRFDMVSGFSRYGHTIDEVQKLVSHSSFKKYRIRGFVNTPAFLREIGDRYQFTRRSVIGLEIGMTALPWSIYTGHSLIVQLFKT